MAVANLADKKDFFVEMNKKSGQLIECINPEHRYLGSIHFEQVSCVGKWEAHKLCLICEKAMPKGQEALDYHGYDCSGSYKADSDESWQASEALHG